MAVRPSRLKAIWRAAFGAAQSQDGIEVIPLGMMTESGKAVTATSALELASAWACIRLLSETVGTLPLTLTRKDSAGNRTPASDDPLYDLLHSSPNHDLTAVEFWEGVVMSLCLTGNSYARKERLGQRVVALTPLRSDRMTVRRNSAGAREYPYHAETGLKVYQEDEIFHVRGFGGAGDVGLSPIAFARHSMGAAMAADEFAGAIFANGARPAGVLTVPQTLDKDQRKQVQDNIVAPYVGSKNAGGLMVLEADFKFQAISMNLEDAQFLQTRAFNVEEICRWFRVPPFMIGHTEKTTSWGTGLEQQMLGFLTFALRPYLVRIEQAINRSLIAPADRKRLAAEFNVEGLLRTDSPARAAFYAVMVQNGIMTRNEVRRLENLPPQAGGEMLTVQSQNVPIGATGSAPPPAGG
jgi:HK97 family phage portal protein